MKTFCIPNDPYNMEWVVNNLDPRDFTYNETEIEISYYQEDQKTDILQGPIQHISTLRTEMNSITIDYIPALGDYLDQLDIKWEGEAKQQKIKIDFESTTELFYIAYNFGKAISER